jgi:acyl carrier protein
MSESRTRETLRKQVQHCLLNILQQPAEVVEWSKPFKHYGLDSVAAFEAAADLEELLKIPIPPTVFWDYPTLERLAEYIEGRMAEQAAETSGAQP